MDEEPMDGKPMDGKPLLGDLTIEPKKELPQEMSQVVPKQESRAADDGRLRVLQDDSYLGQFENDIKLRLQKYSQWIQSFDGEGGLLEVARSFKNFGLQVAQNGDLVYKEWAPSA